VKRTMRQKRGCPQDESEHQPWPRIGAFHGAT
jgi:hypothetical protein